MKYFYGCGTTVMAYDVLGLCCACGKPSMSLTPCVVLSALLVIMPNIDFFVQGNRMLNAKSDLPIFISTYNILLAARKNN